ncbi:dihydrolipoyl dehydrogenase [Paenibacillus sp. 79R4]|uniref:dihydrolipoyl dehydrogenase n=1 Tax=Paenibacillus sp. 79R4 TaxID=2212847 RepID=UPI0015BF067A|nr:dihydrolipoyl dehydrogenase [Paenibacillus sp. 79R4]NWL87988.1 dihydrolipoyl dehydrogenase [Paenibacillus sp. 79R4]
MIIKLEQLTGHAKQAKIGKLNVAEGDQIEIGQPLLQLESKKGNSPVHSKYKGKIEKVLVDEGQEIEIGQSLFEMTAEETAAAPSEVKPKLDYFGGLLKGKKEDVRTDLLVIGAGPGGYVAALYAAKKGIQTVLVEKDSMGGTCLNVGCIPTKALIKSSEVFHQMMHADDFGLSVKEIELDMAKVIDKKDEIKGSLVSGIEYLLGKNNVRVIKGDASFLNDHHVLVKNGKDEYTIEADNTIIATGSQIADIALPGIDHEFVMDSTSALAYRKNISSVTIIGGGVIGMEFAFLYSNFGIQVNVLEFCDRLLTMVDKDVSEEIAHIAAEQGIGVFNGAKVTRIEKDQTGKAVVIFEQGGVEKFITSEKVLVAIGRTPNIDGLELEKTGVKLNDNRKGIAVNEHLQTSLAHIYAIGDVTNRIQLAHVASHEGIAAVDHILGTAAHMDYEMVPNVIFTSPEIAEVGLNEDQARLLGRNIQVSKFPFQANGKALTMREGRGFIKLVKDLDSNKLIGASIIGPEASALISTLTIMIGSGIPEEEIAHAIFAHPTTGEVIHEAILGFGVGALHYDE